MPSIKRVPRPCLSVLWRDRAGILTSTAFSHSRKGQQDYFSIATVHPSIRPTIVSMPWGLKRFQEARCLHFITFSCKHRAPRLNTPRSRDIFEQTLERARQWYGFYVAGYVVMPEHVHLLITEPERANVSLALQMLKQNVARQLRDPEGGSFWEGPLLRFQCLERRQTHRKAALHPPHSGAKRTGGEPRAVAVEQFSSLCFRSRGRGGNRVAVDSANKRAARPRAAVVWGRHSCSPPLTLSLK